jgi:hypothetical protein
VAPSAWLAALKAFDVGSNAAAIYNGGITHNAYFDNTDSRWEYKNSSSSPATFLNIQGGAFVFNIAGNGTAGNAIPFIEAMTLDASGNLVVGDTSPTTGAKFDAVGRVMSSNADNDRIVITQAARGSVPALSDGGTALFGLGNGAAGITVVGDGVAVPLGIGTYGSEALILGTNNTERARITSGGDLLVGMTSTTPSNALGFAVNNSNAGISYTQIQHASGTASGASYEVFYYNASPIGSITQDGTTGVLYNLTSDQRLKENIQDAAPASALIDAIKVRQYNWKSDGSHQRYGFVAQELVTVAPEAVHQPADPEEMMAVDYSKLVPMLVKEIQDLRARVAQLEQGA